MGLFDLFGSKKKTAEAEVQQAEERRLEQRRQAVEDLKKEHEGIKWPTPLPMNLLKTGGQAAAAGAAGITDPLTDERKEEVGALIYEQKITPEDAAGLSLQELLFVMTAHIVFHKASPLPDYESNHRVFYNDLLRRIHEASHLYILYDAATGYPLIDSGFALVYLDEEHAKTAAALYARQFRKAVVMDRAGEGYVPEDESKKQIPLFDYLYYLGMENVLIDNGWYKAPVKRSEISAPPTFAVDPKKIPPAAPALAFAMCDFVGEMRWPVKYDKRDEVVRKKMDRMNALIPGARYVVPVMAGTAGAPAEGELADGQSIPRQEVKFPLVEMKTPDGKTAKKFLPVFTDLFEYSRNFAQTDFKPAAFPYTSLLAFLAGNDGFVINPKGQSIVVPKERAPQIDLQKK